MATHPIKSVFVDATAPAKSTARTHFMARVPLVLTTATEIQTVQVDATTIVVVATSGQVYRYDPADTTSAHDGIIVLVDQDGKRFINSAVYAPRSGVYTNVVSMTETEPPGSPSSGDIYIVAVGATDDWATHDNKIAIFAGGIWYFEIPSTGALAWVNDEAGYVRFTGSAWSSGLSGVLADNSVRLKHLLQGANLVVIGTANSPAGGESDGDIYIVGSSPSGSFSGFTAGRLAIRENGSWVQYTPKTGWNIDNLSTSKQQRWNGTTWTNTSAASIVVKEWGPFSDFVELGTGAGPHAIRSFSATLTTANNELHFFIMCSHTARADADSSLRLYKDAEGSPFYLQVFGSSTLQYPNIIHAFARLAIADTSAHSIRLEVQKAANSVATGFRSSLYVQEIVI
jgi:hypothetical protein